MGEVLVVKEEEERLIFVGVGKVGGGVGQNRQNHECRAAWGAIIGSRL